MLKSPIAGKVKTRLVPPLSKEDAARLYECFILDTFNRISALKDIDIIAAYTPKNSFQKVRNIVPSDILLISQRGKDLGERLHNVFSRLFSVGYKKVAIIGSDSPDLPIEYIKKSFSFLDGEKELVLGPSEDGGYYLVAMTKNCKRLFTGIQWSTGTVFEETLRKAENIGLELAILPKWYDVDDMHSLEILRDTRKKELVATSTLLSKIFKDIRAKTGKSGFWGVEY